MKREGGENGGDRPRQQTDLSGKALQKEHTGMESFTKGTYRNGWIEFSLQRQRQRLICLVKMPEALQKEKHTGSFTKGTGCFFMMKFSYCSGT